MKPTGPAKPTGALVHWVTCSGEARTTSSAEARAESEPWGRARRSFVVFRVLARVRALGSGGAEFAVFRVLARVRALGSGGAEFAVAPLARPDCLSDSLCRVAPQSEWRRRRCPSVRLVSGAVE